MGWVMTLYERRLGSLLYPPSFLLQDKRVGTVIFSRLYIIDVEMASSVSVNTFVQTT